MLHIVDRVGYQALFDETNLFDTIDFAERNDFPVVEANMNSPYFLPEKLDRGGRLRLRRRLEGSGVRLILHAPEGMGIINVQTAVREGCIERMKELVDFAEQVGAARITFHVGSSVPIVSCGERVLLHTIYGDEYRHAFVTGLSRIMEYSRNRVAICIENTTGFRYDFVQESLPEFLKDGVCLTWDIGHANYLKNTHPETDIDFFLAHLDRVKVVHLHDNHGSRDEHNIVGDGTVDFAYFLSFVDSPGIDLIFEVRPREKTLICRENLRRILAREKKSAL